jgi:hypothetical protein
MRSFRATLLAGISRYSMLSRLAAMEWFERYRSTVH